MGEAPQVSSRPVMMYVVFLIVGLVVGAAAIYGIGPARIVPGPTVTMTQQATQTVTTTAPAAPGATVTKTETNTVTTTVTAAPGAAITKTETTTKTTFSTTTTTVTDVRTTTTTTVGGTTTTITTVGGTTVTTTTTITVTELKAIIEEPPT